MLCYDIGNIRGPSNIKTELVHELKDFWQIDRVLSLVLHFIVVEPLEANGHDLLSLARGSVNFDTSGRQTMLQAELARLSRNITVELTLSN